MIFKLFEAEVSMTVMVQGPAFSRWRLHPVSTPSGAVPYNRLALAGTGKHSHASQKRQHGDRSRIYIDSEVALNMKRSANCGLHLGNFRKQTYPRGSETALSSPFSRLKLPLMCLKRAFRMVSDLLASLRRGTVSVGCSIVIGRTLAAKDSYQYVIKYRH